MTFLPTANRELLTAARRSSTFRLRQVVALCAGVLAGLLVLASPLRGGIQTVGDQLFQIISGGAFILSAFAGVFLTADSLSEERRQGTLGLLFLTPLHGFDIVAGKLFACGLNAVGGLLAAFPILAVAWTLGGITAGEFWRMTLVLLITLLFSLASGLWISRRAHSQADASF